MTSIIPIVALIAIFGLRTRLEAAFWTLSAAGGEPLGAQDFLTLGTASNGITTAREDVCLYELPA